MALGAWLLTGACDDGGHDGASRPTVLDSAGVVIVTNSAALTETVPTWHVSPEPDLVIGTVGGDPDQQLYRVRGVLTLADGRVVLGNEGSGEVRVYSEAGVHIRSLGRRGEGPGEFEDLALVGVHGSDTLVVVDEALGRITLLHPDHGLVRTVPVDVDLGAAITPRGIFEDGTVLTGGGFVFPSDPEELRDGYTRGWTRYTSIDLEGRIATEFGEFPGREAYLTVHTSDTGVGVSAPMPAYGRYPMAAVWGRRFYFGSGDSYQVEVRDPAGVLTRLIRVPRPPTPVTAADIERFVAAVLEGVPDENAAARVRDRYRRMPPAKAFPAFGGLAVDALGHLWVEEYRTPARPPEPSYLVFDPEGRVVARVRMPESLGVREIGEDYLLVQAWDDLGTESVRRYRLQRTGG